MTKLVMYSISQSTHISLLSMRRSAYDIFVVIYIQYIWRHNHWYSHLLCKHYKFTWTYFYMRMCLFVYMYTFMVLYMRRQLRMINLLQQPFSRQICCWWCSFQGCKKTCYQRKLIKMCRCGDPHLPLGGLTSSKDPIPVCRSKNAAQGVITFVPYILFDA